MNLAWVKAHWKALLVAAGLALAFGAGWAARGTPPAPAVTLKQDTAAQSASASQTDRHKAEGPVQIVTQTVTKYLPATCTASVTPGVAQGATFTPELAEVDTTTTETRGPVVTDTHELEHTTEATSSHLDLTVTPPAARPGWQVGVGIEDALGARPLRLSVRRRLFGPFWVEAAAVPMRAQLGVGAAIEF